MDLLELKTEQYRLSKRLELNDSFTNLKTIGGISTVVVGDQLLASVVVCEYPNLKIIERKSFLLSDPLPYRPGFSAYREMPAMIEAVNLLENEPDLLLVKGNGILHSRLFGVAAHLGLVLNLPTIGVAEKLSLGEVHDGKVLVKGQVMGFEIITREYAKPLYISQGHRVSLGTIKKIVLKCMVHPHKLPEPLHLANKYARKEK